MIIFRENVGKPHMGTTQKIIKPTCSFCNAEIGFAEGDVIFGDKWFHRDCVSKYRLGKIQPLSNTTPQ